MGGIRNPCRYCNDRNIECHGICDAYKQWKEYHEKQKRKERESVTEWKKGYYHA